MSTVWGLQVDLAVERHGLYLVPAKPIMVAGLGTLLRAEMF